MSLRDGSAAVESTTENAISGAYPLARHLLIYVNKKPGAALPPIEAEFLKLVLSPMGQEIVVEDGYIPLPAAILQRELSKLQ